MKRLYRSRSLRVIAGVAGGIAAYFDLDVTIVRLALALMAVIFPNVILAYVLAWIIIPEAPHTGFSPERIVGEAGNQLATESREGALSDEPSGACQSFQKEPVREPADFQVNRNKQALGYVLIVAGLIFFAKKHVPTYYFRLPIRFLTMWWPLGIIALGLVIVISVVKGDG